MARGSIIPALGPDAQRQIAEDYRKRPVRSETDKAWRAAYPPETQPRKYRNTPTIYKSIQGFERRYDSKKEALFAQRLDTWIKYGTGKLQCWLPQIPFPLPGGVTYRADFMVLFDDGKIVFYDVKGRDTQASKNKRKQVFGRLSC
jgi:Protein of unknown function (DUF1064)